jgi:hypothetical protein|tara:strand:+ start:458 stop:595 length:138 start_codon:yes stop_codon:yes gene_type:complete
MLGIGIGLAIVIIALYLKKRIVQGWKEEYQKTLERSNKDRQKKNA